MEDERIIGMYFERDEGAVTQTAIKYGAYCYTVSYAILACREDCEECVNDTYMRAWNSIPPTRPKNFKMFLAKIARNLSFDRWRAKNAAKRSLPALKSFPIASRQARARRTRSLPTSFQDR